VCVFQSHTALLLLMSRAKGQQGMRRTREAWVWVWVWVCVCVCVSMFVYSCLITLACVPERHV